MSYGLQINNSAGGLTLRVTDRTIRLASVLAVTSPSSGTTTVTVSSSATPTNSIAVLENGATAAVSSTGTVTLNTASFATSGEYNTKLKVYLL
jgi:hypothetical protein